MRANLRIDSRESGHLRKLLKWLFRPFSSLLSHFPVLPFLDFSVLPTKTLKFTKDFLSLPNTQKAWKNQRKHESYQGSPRLNWPRKSKKPRKGWRKDRVSRNSWVTFTGTQKVTFESLFRVLEVWGISGSAGLLPGHRTTLRVAGISSVLIQANWKVQVQVLRFVINLKTFKSVSVIGVQSWIVMEPIRLHHPSHYTRPGNWIQTKEELHPFHYTAAEMQFEKVRKCKCKCSFQVIIMLGANLSDQIPGGPNLTLTLTRLNSN